MNCAYQSTGETNGRKTHYRCAVCGHELWSPFGPERITKVCGIRSIHEAVACGPGTELMGLLDSLGITERDGCGCKANAKQMDAWGVEGCRKRLAEIVSLLRENASKLGWWKKLSTAAKAVTSGLAFILDPLDPFGSLVREAIARAQGSVLITGGIGDFLAIDAGLTDEQRGEIRNIYLATTSAPAIREILDRLPGYSPDRIEAVPVEAGAYFSAAEVPGLPVGCRDFSIGKFFPVYRYQGSATLLATLADAGRFSLPAEYVAIQPSSPRSLREKRNFIDDDWRAVLHWLDSLDVQGVVLNHRGECPDDARLLNLIGKTTVTESIEIVKGACGFAGCASFLSVVASKVLKADRLAVKSGNPHLLNWLHVYYAPHTSFPFVGQTIGAVLRGK